MLEGGGELEVAGVVTLDAFDESNGQCAGKVWVFAVAFIDAAPVGIPADIDDGGAIDEAFVLADEIGVLVPAVVMARASSELATATAWTRSGSKEAAIANRDGEHRCGFRHQTPWSTWFHFIRAQAEGARSGPS